MPPVDAADAPDSASRARSAVGDTDAVVRAETPAQRVLAERVYVALACVFVTCLVLGDITGGKNFRTAFGPVSAGMTLFPVTFLLTDVVNDYYGRKGARYVTLVAAAMAALAYLALVVTTALPVDPSSFFEQRDFEKILGGSAPLFAASLVAFLIGQFLDIYVFQFWKRLTHSRHLWLRATGSTVLSQAVDTVTINAIFQLGVVKASVEFVAAKVLREYLLKVAIAVLLTPLIYALHAFITKRLGLQAAPPDPR